MLNSSKRKKELELIKKKRNVRNTALTLGGLSLLAGAGKYILDKSREVALESLSPEDRYDILEDIAADYPLVETISTVYGQDDTPSVVVSVYSLSDIDLEDDAFYSKIRKAFAKKGVKEDFQILITK